MLGCSKLNTCGTHREEPITKRVFQFDPHGTNLRPETRRKIRQPQGAGGLLWVVSPGVSGRWKKLEENKPQLFTNLSLMTVQKAFLELP